MEIVSFALAEYACHGHFLSEWLLLLARVLSGDVCHAVCSVRCRQVFPECFLGLQGLPVDVIVLLARLQEPDATDV